MREVGSAWASEHNQFIRAVAQLGRAPGSGPGGRGFKSHQPDTRTDRRTTSDVTGHEIDASDRAVAAATGRGAQIPLARLVALLRDYVAPVESAVFSQPTSVSSTSARLNEVLELLRKLMEYRSSEVRHRLEKVGRAASMLHMDVLLLIYHFAHFGAGNVLEIGPYIGGSTIAAAFGARESGTPKKIVSVEAGGRLKHRRIPSRNIFKDLKKNLTRFGVSESVTLINGYSYQETTISAIQQM